MKPTLAPNYGQNLWRLRARETRLLARRVPDPEAKRVVLEIAERCDRLADLIVLVQTMRATASLRTTVIKSS
jgi:hypothetical protein